MYRGRQLGSRSGFIMLGLLGLLACGSADRERGEARRFLGSYGALDHRAKGAERERAIHELEQLPLHVPSVQHARDACVGAHRALLSAELTQEQAAAALDKALASKPNGEALDKSVADGVQQNIVQAETALAGARTRFGACESEAQSLALRFAPR